MQDSSLKPAFDESIEPIEIRPFKPEEWQEFKRIRLEALKEDGAKFRIEARLELIWSDQQWYQRLQDKDFCVAGAFVKNTGRAVAISIVNKKPDDPTELDVGAVWVDKTHRGHNLPIRMLAPFYEWLKSRPEILTIETAHRAGNEASQELMVKAGVVALDRIELDVKWFDGTLADKYFYKGKVPGRGQAPAPVPNQSLPA